jgi:hypothetical protein
MARGLSDEGVATLPAALARHVERGDMPGLVALVACGDDVQQLERCRNRGRCNGHLSGHSMRKEAGPCPTTQ